MNWRWVSAHALGFAVAIQLPSLAQAYDVAGWEIESDWNSCTMGAEFATSTNLIIHYDAEADQTFIMMDNYKWSSKPGEKYDLRYSFGDWYYQIPSVGFEHEGDAGFVTIASDKLLADFANAPAIAVSFAESEQVIEHLKLRGSAAGLQAFKACRGKLRKDAADKAEREKTIPEDPFATGPREPTPDD